MAADSLDGCEVQMVMNEVDRNNFSKALDRKSGVAAKSMSTFHFNLVLEKAEIRAIHS